MENSCSNCGNQVPLSLRFCPACQQDAGFPNRRLAISNAEERALEARADVADASAEAGGYANKLEEFTETIEKKSKAIIARPFATISDLIENDRKLYTTYHLQLAAEARTPEDNEFDYVRTQFESAIAPNFFQQIRFAALTLDGRWLRYFGPYAMILRDVAIAHRATVFEENPVEFIRRLKVLLTQPLPPGYRAVWERRGTLAKAKLYSKLNAETDQKLFAEILLNEDPSKGTFDYIEVHIFGSFNRNSIERIAGPAPRTREDKFLWGRLKKQAKIAGVSIEEVP